MPDQLPEEFTFESGPKIQGRASTADANKILSYSDANALLANDNLLLATVKDALTRLAALEEAGPVVVVPAQVTTWNVSPGNTQAVVTFTAVAGATSYAAKYRHTGTGSYVTGATGSTSPLTITGLSNDSVYDITITASNSAGAGDVSVVKQVTPAAPVTNTVQVLATDWQENTYTTATQADGSPAISALATLDFRLVGTGFTADITNYTGYSDGFVNIPVYKAGVYVGSLQPTSARNQTATFSPPLPAGTHDLTLTMGGNTSALPSTFVGTTITRLTATAGTVELRPRPRAANRVTVGGDSIAAGQGADSTRLGWIPVMRRSLPAGQYEIAFTGWGNCNATGRFSTPELAGEEAARVTAFLGDDGQHIDWTVTNNYGANPQTPADTTTARARVWDAIHALKPNIKIRVMGILPRTTTSNPNTLQSYDDAAAAAVATRSGFCTFHPTSDWLSLPGDYTDGLHPNTGGHAKNAARMSALVQGIAYVPAYEEGAVILPTDAISSQYLTEVGPWNDFNNPSAVPDGNFRLSGQGSSYSFPMNASQAKFDFFTDNNVVIAEIAFSTGEVYTMNMYSGGFSGMHSFTTPPGLSKQPRTVTVRTKADQTGGPGGSGNYLIRAKIYILTGNDTPGGFA